MYRRSTLHGSLSNSMPELLTNTAIAYINKYGFSDNYGSNKHSINKQKLVDSIISDLFNKYHFDNTLLKYLKSHNTHLYDRGVIDAVIYRIRMGTYDKKRTEILKNTIVNDLMHLFKSESVLLEISKLYR